MSPFRSEAQRRWMHANHPAMAKQWELDSPHKKLPRHVSPKLKRRAPMPVGPRKKR